MAFQYILMPSVSALTSSPKLLLLDEPFIGVAPKLVDEILDALRLIANRAIKHEALGKVYLEAGKKKIEIGSQN